MISSNTYKEVYEILSYMDKITVMKIPESILNRIREQRNINFQTRIDKEDIFNEENVSQETIDFLCWLNYKYWLNEEQKKEIDRIKLDKYKELEEYKKKTYNDDDIFKNKQIKKNSDIQEIAISDCQEKNFIRRIFNKIKKIFYNH